MNRDEILLKHSDLRMEKKGPVDNRILCGILKFEDTEEFKFYAKDRKFFKVN